MLKKKWLDWALAGVLILAVTSVVLLRTRFFNRENKTVSASDVSGIVTDGESDPAWQLGGRLPCLLYAKNFLLEVSKFDTSKTLVSQDVDRKLRERIQKNLDGAGKDESYDEMKTEMGESTLAELKMFGELAPGFMKVCDDFQLVKRCANHLADDDELRKCNEWEIRRLYEKLDAFVKRPPPKR